VGVERWGNSTRGRHERTTAPRPTLAVADVAWLAAVPAAALLAVVVVLLGPPLGRVLPPAGHVRFWAYLRQEGSIRPEPTEHARYLLAAIGPLVLAGALALLCRRRKRRLAGGRLLVMASQVAVVAAIGCCVVAPHLRASETGLPTRVYFTWSTLAVALAFSAAAFAALRSRLLAARLAALTHETGARRALALVVALILTATWLLAAVNSDRSIGDTPPALWVNIPFWLDESFAVLDGLAPLATFHAQYANLWPYAGAAAMALLGTTLTVYSATMAAAAGVSMLAVFGLLRRVAGSSLGAIALYAPFLATSFFTEQGPLGNRWGPVNAFSMFPMRYGGPYVLAWLACRHLDGAQPRGRRLLLVAGGVVALDNVEFGIPAFAATLAALLWTARGPARIVLPRLAADAAIGVLGAAGLVAALTFAVAGRLPDFGGLFVYSRLFAVEGLAMLPIPHAVNPHLAIYLTFAAALVAASVRVLGAGEGRPLTGMLAWSGVFGLGVVGYYAGRSHPDVLIDVFSAWALAVSLLAVVAVRSIRAPKSGRLAIGQLAALAGLGLTLCSLAQAPVPWEQLARIRHPLSKPLFAGTAAEAFVRRETRRGERIAIMGPLGHRIGTDLGRSDVVPYATLESMETREMLEQEIDALRRQRIRHAFVMLVPTTQQEHVDLLRRGGWRPVAQTSDVLELRRDGGVRAVP
jgi:hypothetical protein